MEVDAVGAVTDVVDGAGDAERFGVIAPVEGADTGESTSTLEGWWGRLSILGTLEDQDPGRTRRPRPWIHPERWIHSVLLMNGKDRIHANIQISTPRASNM